MFTLGWIPRSRLPVFHANAFDVEIGQSITWLWLQNADDTILSSGFNIIYSPGLMYLTVIFLNRCRQRFFLCGSSPPLLIPKPECQRVRRSEAQPYENVRHGHFLYNFVSWIHTNITVTMAIHPFLPPASSALAGLNY